MKEAVLYEKYDKNRIKCTACMRYCILQPGQSGFCGIRKNIDGKLYLLTYGRPFAINVDPIEKKPVLHMYPGYRILSFGTTGCNYACKYCQNYDMSQRKDVQGLHMSPGQMVELAVENRCEGIAYTYNEPTVLIEYAHDIGVIARKKGLINIFVSNGHESKEAVEYAKDFLDLITVDFKGNASNEFYRKFISVPSADPIFESIRWMKQAGFHLEITDLVVPGVGDHLSDARRMIERIVDILGTDVPLSFLRFHPDYKMLDYPSTPVKTLEAHHDLARDMGMKYVYIGNVSGHRAQNTYCPRCGALSVKRDIFESEVKNLTRNGKCSKCDFNIGISLGRKDSDYLLDYR